MLNYYVYNRLVFVISDFIIYYYLFFIIFLKLLLISLLHLVGISGLGRGG